MTPFRLTGRHLKMQKVSYAAVTLSIFFYLYSTLHSSTTQMYRRFYYVAFFVLILIVAVNMYKKCYVQILVVISCTLI
jgi:hypothetical protein